MSRTAAIIERADILSTCVLTQFFACPDEENRKKSHNFSHLFRGPRYPIFYLGSIGHRTTVKRSTIVLNSAASVGAVASRTH